MKDMIISLCRSVILFIFGLLLVFDLYGQRSREVPSKEQHPSIPIMEKYLGLQQRYVNISSDSSILFGRMALRIAEEIGDFEGLAEANHYLAKAHALNGEFQLAISSEQTAMALSSEHNLYQLSIDAQAALARWYVMNKEFVKSSNTYLHLMQIADSLADKKLKSDIWLGLAEISATIYDFDQARSNYHKSLELSKETGNRSNEADALLGLSDIMLKTGELKAADSCVEQSIRQYIIEHNPRKLVSALLTKASINIKLGNHLEAQRVLHDSDSITRKHQWNLDADINFRLGLISLEENRPDAALTYFSRVVPLMEKSQFYSNADEVYAGMALANMNLNKHEEAYLEMSKAYDLRVDYFEEFLVNQLVDIQNAYRSNLKEGKLNSLSNDIEIQELNLSAERRKKYLMIGGSLVLAVIAVLLVIGFRTKAKLTKALRLKYEEVQSQIRIIEGINMELKAQAIRAQMNPHFVFNCLNSIQSLVLKGEVDAAYRYIDIFSRLLTNVFSYVDKQWITLREEMEMLELYIELESLRFKTDFDYNITVEGSISAHKEELIPSMLVQPFVENSLLHGLDAKLGKKHLDICFSRNDRGRLVCRVEDNGIGRRESSARKIRTSVTHEPKALKLIEQRIKVLDRLSKSNSSLEIVDLIDDSEDVVGTQVILEFPHA